MFGKSSIIVKVIGMFLLNSDNYGEENDEGTTEYAIQPVIEEDAEMVENKNKRRRIEGTQK